MSKPIPSDLSLTVVQDGASIIASDHRNNYSAIQGAVNEIRDAVAGGSSGQFLRAVDASHIEWGTPGLISVTRLLPGTISYTAPTETRILDIDGWGGGGGGSGCAASGAAQISTGAGGSGGGFAAKTLTTNIGTHVVAIGIGGTGGATGANNGGNGGDTTFADSTGANVLTAKGGLGATGNIAGGTSISVTSSVAGAAGNVGDTTIQAASGSRGVRLSGTVGYTGEGGQSPRGGASFSRMAGIPGDGNTGIAPGGGGSGGLDSANVARAGGTGGAGQLTIRAYG